MAKPAQEMGPLTITYFLTSIILDAKHEKIVGNIQNFFCAYIL